MKYLVVLCDGMADEPIEELNGLTPLEAAKTPNMDRLAPKSEIGIVYTVPEGMAPGSDTANLSVVGYDPKKYYSGRSPLEALSIGVDMAPTDVSFRCNVITVSEDGGAYEDQMIVDHSASEITSEEAAVLIDTIKDELKYDGYDFYAGVSYRHLTVWRDGELRELTPPHDVLGRRVGDYLPSDPVLREMQVKSYDILKNHPINIERKKHGLNPANTLWFWGAGTKPALMSFEEKTGKRGAMISAVDLLKGIAVGAGMDNITVEGANAGLHTNYLGKGQAAVDALLKDGYDFVYIHVEAPDEMGHQGKPLLKADSISYIDEQIVGPVVKALEEAGEDFRMMILPDHPTPVRIRTHVAEPVPYLLYDSTKEAAGCESYNERTAAETKIVFKKGYTLIDHLFNE